MKAIGLFSGGLDSALAIKLIQEQGIDVVAFHYKTPFVNITKQTTTIEELAKKLGADSFADDAVLGVKAIKELSES